jgi:hypothetical protein
MILTPPLTGDAVAESCGRRILICLLIDYLIDYFEQMY